MDGTNSSAKQANTGNFTNVACVDVPAPKAEKNRMSQEAKHVSLQWRDPTQAKSQPDFLIADLSGCKTVKDLQTLICAEMKLEQSKQEVCVHLLPARALTRRLARWDHGDIRFLTESAGHNYDSTTIVSDPHHLQWALDNFTAILNDPVPLEGREIVMEESKGTIELFTREVDCDSFESFTSADAQHVLRWFDVDKGVRVEILTEDATISRQLQVKLKVEHDKNHNKQVEQAATDAAKAATSIISNIEEFVHRTFVCSF